MGSADTSQITFPRLQSQDGRNRAQLAFMEVRNHGLGEEALSANGRSMPCIVGARGKLLSATSKNLGL
jgi:hypothetical protein